MSFDCRLYMSGCPVEHRHGSYLELKEIIIPNIWVELPNRHCELVHVVLEIVSLRNSIKTLLVRLTLFGPEGPARSYIVFAS
jgi:hypothetical protein